MKETTRVTRNSPDGKETVTIKKEQQKKEPTREGKQLERSRIQENIKNLISGWRGKEESDQDLTSATREYMAVLNASEIEPTEEEKKWEKEIKAAMRLASWDLEDRK